MKKMMFAIATLAIMTAGTMTLSAQTSNPAPGNGQKQGPRKGKKLGPQDGSGPIHQLGTGGGNGGGGRRGRR